MTFKRKIQYREAVNEAIIQSMKKDKDVFVMGPDVADHKKSYGITVNIVETFGKERCFSTPLSEEGLMGMALGASMKGMRPIYMHIRVDFLILALNQLFNMVASCHYGSGGKLKAPMVIRAVIGRGWGQSYQHSKSLQSIFAHIPGLKVVMPTTPKDAKGLMMTAIKDNNPVVYLEHRWLHDAEDYVPEKEYIIPFGKANVVKVGKDVTIIATSWMNVEALEAADILSRKAGIKIEIIDPRTIAPLDEATIIKSVTKTGHCIVADYDWVNYGFGAEIAARVQEKCFGKLKSPISRLGFAATHCPTTRPLENAFYPTAIDIIRTVEEKLKLKKTDLKDEKFYSYENKFKGPF
jgi:acetoin:2,6-dichlorophenolindophenol oxidoreductase subunit beta